MDFLPFIFLGMIREVNCNVAKIFILPLEGVGVWGSYFFHYWSVCLKNQGRQEGNCWRICCLCSFVLVAGQVVPWFEMGEGLGTLS